MLRRPIGSALVAIALLLPVLAACSPAADSGAAQAIRIYQVMPVARKSKLVKAPGDGEMIAVINTGSTGHTISNWAVQTGQGKAVLPKLTLKPGQVITLADGVAYFKSYWGSTPSFEYGADTDKAVPDLKLPDGKPPMLNDQGDVVQLLDDKGSTVDILAFGNVGNPPLPWSGPAVQFVNSFPLTPAGQVITRMKQGASFLLEPRAASFSGGTLTEPQRVYFAGQTDFPVTTVSAKGVTLMAASAPDNAGQLLFDLVDKAQKSIRMVGYQYTAEALTSHLIAAVKRNVRVQVVIERNPGGGDLFETDKIVHQKLREGGVEVLYYYKWDGDLSTRYNPVHNKYAIFDDDTALIASGNWVNSVYNTDPSCGNREWIAAIKGSAAVMKLFTEVYDRDYSSGAPEVRPWSEKLDASRKPDDYDPGPCFKYTPVKPQYQTFTGDATFTRILSPDNTLDRETGFLGQLRSARQELLISANYINLWWGAAGDAANLTKYPQPYLTEIMAAARRGVDVKVIMDRRSVRIDGLRDNHYTAKYLNDLAAKENLKLEARLVNADNSGIGRTYHNKSLIVDDAAIISSINGSENSFRYAREMALKIAGVPAFTQYYRDLFLADWTKSAQPNEPWNVSPAPRNAGTFLDWSPNVELDVHKYELYYKPTASAAWTRLGEVDRPGFEDTHQSGTWGVVAVNDRGLKSNYAEVSR